MPNQPQSEWNLLQSDVADFPAQSKDSRAVTLDFLNVQDGWHVLVQVEQRPSTSEKLACQRSAWAQHVVAGIFQSERDCFVVPQSVWFQLQIAEMKN
mmetsp:Transcript_6435/g.13505  ORF Transcript_6435/g.13505 Transcript_6435/m.13505 type:complete len:97 (+) Transcript_6435:1286-1576(+)